MPKLLKSKLDEWNASKSIEAVNIEALLRDSKNTETGVENEKRLAVT